MSFLFLFFFLLFFCWVCILSFFISIEHFIFQSDFSFHRIKLYTHIFELVQLLCVLMKYFQAWIVIFCTVRSADIAYSCTLTKKFSEETIQTCNWNLLERSGAKCALGCAICVYMWEFFTPLRIHGGVLFLLQFCPSVCLCVGVCLWTKF